MSDTNESQGRGAETNAYSSHSRSESRRHEGEGPRQLEYSEEGDSHSIGEFIGQYPLTAMLAGFGVGVGLGALAVAVLCRREEEHGWIHGLSTPSMQDISSGLRKLPDKVADYVPRSLHWR